MTNTESVVIRSFSNATGKPVSLTDKISDLSVDSLDLLDLVLIIEERCDCELPNMGLDDFVYVGDVVNYVDKL